MTEIGAHIRQARLARGLSQGDLERRTGLLRCYLSRVENGHTEPSLQTLARLAQALEMPLVGFFTPDAEAAAPGADGLTVDERTFLAQMQACAAGLSETGREQLLALARKMAATKSS